METWLEERKGWRLVFHDEVVHFWLAAYGSARTRSRFFTARYNSAYAFLFAIAEHVVPRHLGGTARQEKLGKLIKKLLVDVDKSSSVASALRAEDIDTLAEIFRLIEPSPPMAARKAQARFEASFSGELTPERLSGLCAV